MRALTIYFGEALEERERERRKRSRKVVAGALVVAALGIGFGLRDVPAAPVPSTEPAPERITVTETVYVDRPVLDPNAGAIGTEPRPEVVERSERTEGTKRSGVGVLPAFGRRFDDVAPAQTETLEPRTRHLCISPKTIRFEGGVSCETVTVSNPSAGSIVVTGITATSDRKQSGLDVDDSGCANRWLEPGEQCAIVVRLRHRIGETMQLRVSQDASDDVETTTVEAREQ
jgi:hypothetical protein